VLDAAARERIEDVHLVQDELEWDVVGADLGQHGGDGLDRLGEALLGERRVGDVDDEIGNEGFLERGGESLDELRGEPPDEADRVGDEIPLPVVVEEARRRIERFEQAVVDGRVGARQRVQEGRLADVRIPGERDRRNARAQTLLATRGALAAKPTKTAFQQRDARASDAPVGLELALARPPRPHPAAESLEVLPHAPHAREVVLELRELDLQLPLGAARVLGEDVEDQLRSVDDASLQRVFEYPLLRRAELVVDEQDLGSTVRVLLLELAELAPPDEAPRIRMLTVLHDLPDRVDSGGPGELTELVDLRVGVHPFRVHGDEKSALRLRPGCGIGLAGGHCGIMPRYAPPVTTLADRLAARTLELVDIPSPSGAELAIRERVLELIPSSWEAEYEGDEAYFFLSPRRVGRPLVTLAGHYDTVPAQGNVPGYIADGAVHGVGASDMKGGLAVALELARDLDPAAASCDLALLVFGREELPADHNPLPALFAGSTSVHESTLAIVLEPTDLTIQAGCLGNVVARVTFHGTSGHAARPWLADSALERAVRGLEPIFELAPRAAVVHGLEFREVVSVTGLHAGIADNVIPGEASATLNLRYPPDRTPQEAEAFLAGLVPADGTLEIVSNAAPAAVVVDSSAVRALQAAGGLEIQPKQAWTNVADFTARGLDAVNFGPGHTALAHHPRERVAIDALVGAYEILHRFVTGPMGEDRR
jgi:succinyl-diaminopimelate desuccinylase